MGDGECNEGQVWEAAQNRAHFRLDNLTAIIDHNKFQSTDAVTARMNPISLAEKFRAFGWETKEIDGNDVAVVVDALVAAEVLEKENIHARVLDMHTIKPLDEAAVISAAKDTGAIVTAEDASVIGGLGGAVAELVSEKAPAVVRRVGVNDRFGDSGKTEELKEIFGLTAASICRAVREAIAAKGQEGWKERGLEGEKVRRKEGK